MKLTAAVVIALVLIDVFNVLYSFRPHDDSAFPVFWATFIVKGRCHHRLTELSTKCLQSVNTKKQERFKFTLLLLQDVISIR